MLKNFFTFSRFTLFVALCISAIAAWYSVLGLTAIFAGAVIPIIIMGGILEVAKITTTVWLHRYWDQAGTAIKTYLTIAVFVLAGLTSMGIFGLLSKAHLDQNVGSGEVAAKVSLLDEKIKTQRDNIETARKALAQMDAQVEQRLSRSDSETGAERAVQIRRQQAPERARLLKEISDAQKEITKLNEERAPVASQLRKVEAEVGPVKYIAALIYGDNPDITLLEKAVRWVIILIVVVFDPLAIVLILAANNSLKWERENKQKSVVVDTDPVVDTLIEELEGQNVQPPPVDGETPEWREKISKVENSTPWPTFLEDPDTTEEKQQDNATSTPTVLEVSAKEPEFTEEEKKALTKFIYENLIEPKKEVVEKPTISQEEISAVLEISQHLAEPIVVEPTVIEPTAVELPQTETPVIQTEGQTKEIFVSKTGSEYIEYEGKSMSIDALKHLHPELVIQDKNAKNDLLFGTQFPTVAKKGDIYTRVDIIPHRVYKFNGGKWIEVDKTQNTTYLQNLVYIQHLISKIDSGEYDPEMLTSYEQDEISDYLKRTT